MAARTSGSFRRFLVTGLTPSPDDDSFFEKLREHRFRTIDDQPVADSSSGWVVADTFQSSDFRPETVFFGPVVRLRIRLDQKRLPTNSIRVRLAEAVSSIGGRIARSARTKLKDDIEKELLGRTVPSTNVFEVYWRPRDEILLLSSSSVGA
ncbi:MAG: recombination-associated protein RdgC, partial [Myxococcota bacterium]|nr:recombination-associated protein RdgC [Myxococcota bacterium]